jgi:hypothetical protein
MCAEWLSVINLIAVWGTLSLLAGIDLLTGKVHALVRDRHRSREFIEFLKLLDDGAGELGEEAFDEVEPGAMLRLRFVHRLTPCRRASSNLRADHSPPRRSAHRRS